MQCGRQRQSRVGAAQLTSAHSAAGRSSPVRAAASRGQHW